MLRCNLFVFLHVTLWISCPKKNQKNGGQLSGILGGPHGVGVQRLRVTCFDGGDACSIYSDGLHCKNNAFFPNQSLPQGSSRRLVKGYVGFGRDFGRGAIPMAIPLALHCKTDASSAGTGASVLKIHGMRTIHQKIPGANEILWPGQNREGCRANFVNCLLSKMGLLNTSFWLAKGTPFEGPVRE